MDRRNFFKRFGAVTVVPFMPLKWERPKEVGYTGSGDDNPSQSTHGTTGISQSFAKKVKVKGKQARGDAAFSIHIDSYDFTNLCTRIEVTKENAFEFLPPDVRDLTGIKHYLDYPSMVKGRISGDFILSDDADAWRKFNLVDKRGDWHFIEILNRPTEVMYKCKAMLVRMNQRAEVGDLVRVELEFVTEEFTTTTIT